MAADTPVVTVLVCKRCKRTCASGPKCKICNSNYHLSCAKLSNVKLLDDETLLCCEYINVNVSEKECDDAFYEALEELSGSEKKVDINIFNYIVKQKDIIIVELREQVELLKKQISILSVGELMQKNQSAASTATSAHRKAPASQATNNAVKSITGSMDTGSKSFAATVAQVPQPVSSRYTTTNQNKHNTSSSRPNSRITHSEVNAAILQAKSANKMKELQELDVDNNPNQDWAMVRPKRRKNHKFIIGSNNDETSKVRAVHKFVDLHVTRLNPQTTIDDLTCHLKTKFPEVRCELIKSKYPDVYASCKVSVWQENLKEAWTQNVWPNGALVSHFLKKRMRITPDQ